MKSKKSSPVLESTDSSGNVHKTVGYRSMKPAPDAVAYEPGENIKGASLPKKVDMRPMMTAIENQGQTSSCVANAVAGAYEYWIKRITGKEFDLSRLFVYYNARWRAGDQDKDGGSYIQMAMEGLGDFGVCSEATWPFDKKILKTKPNRTSYKEGADFRVNTRKHVPVELEAWKRCLAEGMPIVFGCVLFESFDKCNQQGGVVPMPSPKEVTRESHGGHSMCCVGYSDVDEVFIVRNSWGKDWGEDGYCYMPYNYLMNPKFNDGDCWVFVPDDSLPLPEDIWVDDEVPVVNRGKGVDFLINAFSIAAYATIAIDLFECFYTADYYDEVVEEYSEYSEYVEEEKWEEIEEFDYEEIVSESEETEEEDDSEEEEDDEEEDDSEEEEDDEEEDDSEEEEDDEEEDDSEEEGDDEEEDDSEEEEDDEEEDDSEEEEEDDEEEDDSEEEGDDEEEDDSEEEEEDDEEEEDSEEEEEDDEEEEEEDEGDDEGDDEE